MDKIVEDVITIEAKALAKKHNIADEQRVVNIMKRLAMDCNGIRFLESRNTKDPLSEGLTFYPSLDTALVFMTPEKALSLFETVDIDELASKVSWFDFLIDDKNPFYTHDEFAALIKHFIAYLKANKSSLMGTGYPMKSFEKSPWLYDKLSRLYPVKVPLSIQGRSLHRQKIAEEDGVAERDDDGNLIYNFTWAKECTYPHVDPLDEITECLYNDAPLIKGLKNEDVEHIDENRAKIFNLKIDILEIAARYLEQGQQNIQNEFWDECIEKIARRITRDAIRQFEIIDGAYAGLFIVRDSPDFLITRPSAFTQGQANLDTGGIENIIGFIFCIEAELKFRSIHDAKIVLANLPSGRIPSSYYESALTPDMNAVDNALDCLIKKRIQIKDFFAFFNKRLGEDSEKKLKMLLEVSVKNYDKVKNFIPFAETWTGDITFCPNTANTVLTSKKITPLELPSGAKWEDITIEFIDGHNVKIKCKGKTFRSDYKDMGFEDRKIKKPDVQWELLNELAKNKGELSWEKYPASKRIDTRKVDQDFGHEFDEDSTSSQNKGYSIFSPKLANVRKKRKENLSKTLKAVFPIDGDPFYPYEEVKAYKIRIKLIP